MHAELIFTGDELLHGEVLNTNAQYLGQQLAALGIEVSLHITVGDNWQALKKVLAGAVDRADLIIITGGLGPTSDDLTKETVADFGGLELLPNSGILHKLENIFRQRGMAMPERVKKQALVPRGALVLPNHAGMAPGISMSIGGKTVILLPGPPHELMCVFEGAAKKLIGLLAGQGMVIWSSIIKMTGISESQVEDELNKNKIYAAGNPSIAFVAMPGEVHVRITGRSASRDEAREKVEEVARQVRMVLKDYIFSADGEVLREAVGRLLVDRQATVSFAESCTGGQVMKQLSDVPGSSRYLVGGVVAYSNELKIKLLGVPREIIDRHGAVSEQTARLMAEGIRRVTGALLGVGITGIAGPEGGTPEKPLGLVYIALAGPDQTICQKYHFPGQREGVRSGAANASLNMIQKYFYSRPG